MDAMVDDRRDLGRLGEWIAAAFLERHGGRIVARNFEVGGGEIDLVCDFNGVRTLVEVRTVRSRRTPAELFPAEKRHRLRRLATVARCRRIDLVAVWVRRQGVEIRWIPELG